MDSGKQHPTIRFLTMTSQTHLWRGCCFVNTRSADIDDNDERNPSMSCCKLLALQIWQN